VQALCLHLLCERRRGEDSFWYPYIDMLPSQARPNLDAANVRKRLCDQGQRTGALHVICNLCLLALRRWSLVAQAPGARPFRPPLQPTPLAHGHTPRPAPSAHRASVAACPGVPPVVVDGASDWVACGVAHGAQAREAAGAGAGRHGAPEGCRRDPAMFQARVNNTSWFKYNQKRCFAPVGAVHCGSLCTARMNACTYGHHVQST
jgi:hypothetical protein